MDNQNLNTKPRHNSWLCCGECGKGGGYGFAILLLAIGGFFLARDLGWIDLNVSLWPIVLIVFGAYLIIVKSTKK